MRKWLDTITGLLVALPLMAGRALAETAHDAAAAATAATPAIINPATAWNHTWDEMLWDLWIVGGVFGVVAIWLLIKFRAKSPNAVGTAQPLNLDKALAWSLVPAALFMADDFLLAAKGWTLWNIQRTVPAGAMEVKVTGNQWFFEYEYDNGVKDTELVVPVGKPVVLRMTSNDVIHSFGLNEFRVKEDIMPGRITYIWFYPEKPVVTNVVCVEFCGMAHSQMTNAVRAIDKAEFDQWLADKAAKKKTSELDATKRAEAAPAATTHQ